MPITPKTTGTILALDVGDKRVGVARASLVARLPEPLTTLERSEDFLAKLRSIIADESAMALVVGLPRGLDGQTTEQTRFTETFAQELKQQLDLPLYFQDEALTSRKAHAELGTRKAQYQRGEVDALAATYILDDFLAAHPAETGI